MDCLHVEVVSLSFSLDEHVESSSRIWGDDARISAGAFRIGRLIPAATEVNKPFVMAH